MHIYIDFVGHLHITVYHPAENGLVERFHRQLQAAIKCHAEDKWTESLLIVLLRIRAALPITRQGKR